MLFVLVVEYLVFPFRVYFFPCSSKWFFNWEKEWQSNYTSLWPGMLLNFLKKKPWRDFILIIGSPHKKFLQYSKPTKQEKLYRKQNKRMAKIPLKICHCSNQLFKKTNMKNSQKNKRERQRIFRNRCSLNLVHVTRSWMHKWQWSWCQCHGGSTVLSWWRWMALFRMLQIKMFSFLFFSFQ